MRKIKFRGIKIHKKEMIYGDYLYNPKLDHHIITELREFEDNEDYRADYAGNYKYYLARQETIGQYTNVKDINGVEIFEGDVIQVLDENREPTEIREVEYNNGLFYPIGHFHNVEYEVLGNIHENPKLREMEGFVPLNVKGKH